MFQKIQVFLLGFFLWVCLSVGVRQSLGFAAPLMQIDAIPQSRMQALLKRLDLESEADRFLTAIPADYYTIATVEALKTQLENPQTLHLLGYENVRGFPPSFKGWQAAGEAIASR